MEDIKIRFILSLPNSASSAYRGFLLTDGGNPRYGIEFGCGCGAAAGIDVGTGLTIPAMVVLLGGLPGLCVKLNVN